MIKLIDILEGTCGYGLNGELGEEPAGPHLLKKKKRGVNEKVNREVKQIYKLLIKYGNTAKDAMDMIKKNMKYVDKTYRNSSPRGKAMALVGLSALGESTNENLRKWFSDKWVNIGKKKKGGGHPPCGSSGKKRGYAKCVPASKAAGMSKKQKASATRRKRAAQNKAGRGGTSSLKGGGKKPIRVSTKPKK